MNIIKSILVCTSIAASGLSYGKTVEKKFDAKNLSKLYLEAMKSNIKVVGSDESDALVVVKINRQDEKRCTYEIKTEGNRLIVDVDWEGKDGNFNFSTDKNSKNPSHGDMDNCDIDFELRVPRTFDVELKSVTGITEVSDLGGDIDLSKVEGGIKISGQGGELEVASVSSEIQLDGKFSEINVKSVESDVKFKGVCPDMVVNLVSGDTEVKYTEVIEKGEFRVRTMSGNANLYLPKGMKVITDHTAMSGSEKNYFGDAKDGNFEIFMKSFSGDLVIDKM